MKRICSLFLLVIILFNIIGFYGVLSLAQRRLGMQLIERIEANASEMSGNLILAIPVTVPYAPDADAYTRLDGELVMGKEVYRLVKQKIYHNMLYVVCIRDHESSRAREALSDYTKSFSGQPVEQTNSAIKIFGTLAKYCIVKFQGAKATIAGWCLIIHPRQFLDLYTFSCSSLVFHPPQYS